MNTFQYTEKVKLRVGDLRLGMFVCELDRPWLESPFLLQGFELKTEADLDAVRKHCKHVYIDMLRSRSEHVVLDMAPPPRSFLNDQKTFHNGIHAAEQTRQQSAPLVQSFFEGIHLGKSPDVQVAKSAASVCVASVLSNPETMMLVTQLREKDEEMGSHALNVCAYAAMLGHALGLPRASLEELATSGLLHDIGETSVPTELIRKRNQLTPEEWALLRQHTSLGKDILSSGRNVYTGVVDVAYSHHENIDGTGYPRKLQGHQLSAYTKIVSVVERYDALTSDRRYREAQNHLEAIRTLSKMAEKGMLDSNLVGTFITQLGVYPPGCIVQLSNGEVAIVLQSNPRQRLRPIILVIRDTTAEPIERLVDLSLKDSYAGQPYKISAVRRAKDLGVNMEAYRKTILACL